MKNNFELFLDDEREPHEFLMKRAELLRRNFLVFRSGEEAYSYISRIGFPEAMYLDHDLGPDKWDGSKFLDELNNFILGNLEFFDIRIITKLYGNGIYIHSQNPVGVQNMQGKILSMLKHLNGSHKRDYK